MRMNQTLALMHTRHNLGVRGIIVHGEAVGSLVRAGRNRRQRRVTDVSSAARRGRGNPHLVAETVDRIGRGVDL